MMASRTLRWTGTAAAGVAMLLAGMWGALAIWFRLAPASPSREILAGGLLLMAFLAVVCLGLRRWRVVALYGLCFAVIFGWWATLRPSNDHIWADDVARTAEATIEGDRLVVRNVRDFLWRTDTDFDARWETRAYNLKDLTSVDLIMSYWTGETIAHAIVSFGFSDGRQLAFSIEIRKEKAETYSALAGFFRAYELSFIAADERDVLGVRSNVRGEDVRIYRLRLTPAQTRALLLEYVDQINSLAKTPRFYNSLTANCTTQIFRMARALDPTVTFDYRVLLAGYFPNYVYDRGAMDSRLSFAAVRDRSHIQGKAANTDPDFSSKIREGVPDPRSPVR